MTQTNTNSDSQAKFLILLAIGILFTASAGYVYGRYSQRWGPTVDLVAAGKHLQTLPQQIGDWQMLDKLLMDESTIDMLQCAGYVNWRYINQKTGDTVSLALIVGPPGPIAVHTPEICYSSRAYTLLDSKNTILVDGLQGSSHSFWKTTFKPNQVTSDKLRVYYAWAKRPAKDTIATWTAASKGRYQYGAEPLLYKLQIAGALVRDGSVEGRDSSQQFLSALCKSGWNVADTAD